MLFLSVRGFFDYAGPINPLAINVVVVLPSSLPERSRHPDPSVFRSSIARPTDTSVYASSATCKTRGQDGVAASFPVGLFHPLQHAGLPRRTPCNRLTNKVAHTCRNIGCVIKPASSFQAPDLGRIEDLFNVFGGEFVERHELGTALTCRTRSFAL
jgi:hypothetical protein